MSTTTMSPPPFPKSVAVPAIPLQTHYHSLNLSAGDHHNQHVLVLSPPPKPSSLRRPEEPPNIILRPLEAPPRPIINDFHLKSSAGKTKPRRKSSTTDVLRLMDALSLPLPPETYSSLVKECTQLGDADEALELHRHLKRSGIKPSLVLLNRVLLMHVSCGCIFEARQLFDEMPQRDIMSWAVLYAAFMEDGEYDEVIRVFLGILGRFRSSEVPLWIMGCVLKACLYSMSVELGKQVHGCILKTGKSDDKLIQICLFNFYGKLKSGNAANTAFAQLQKRDSVAWTAKIVSGTRKKRFREVVSDFREMCRTGIRSTSRTVSCAIKACSRIKDGGDCGKQIHANAIKVGLETSHLIPHRLVDMYAKNGLLNNARRVHDEMEVYKRRNIACSNAMIKAYLQNGFSVEAIKLLYQRKAEGIPCPEALVEKVRELSGS